MSRFLTKTLHSVYFVSMYRSALIARYTGESNESLLISVDSGKVIYRRFLLEEESKQQAARKIRTS